MSCAANTPLAYKLADFRRDGRYRTVSVIAQHGKDLSVRARPGYYGSASVMEVAEMSGNWKREHLLILKF